MFVEVHIVQNFAPSCLNRDDTNAPKDCVFGGFRRARISSQCIKRSVRKYFADHKDELGLAGILGTRTKLLHQKLVELAVAGGRQEEEAARLVKFAIEGAPFKMDGDKTSVLLFLGENQVKALADALLQQWPALKKAADAPVAAPAEKDDKKSAKKKKAEKKEGLPEEVRAAFDGLKQGPHAADIALFGRMIAERDNMNVDAACQVAHAISTNEVDMEMDFYTAVDDLQPKEETGAGMMGIVEFNSSCFYRYALVDTRQLEKNLGGDKELSRESLLSFVKALVYAIPSGKQNSMAAQNLPSYVRVVLRSDAPRSLANAFLKPVRPKRREEQDLSEASVMGLESHARALSEVYGKGDVKLDFRASLFKEHSDGSLDNLMKGLEKGLQEGL
jgi:CRISPR system Cascade subunit CasC